MDYSSTPCKFFKVGHCKYGASCQFLHPPTCTIPQCPEVSCPNRHPRQCKHHLKFGFCKFGDMCSFSHSTASPSLPISPPTCASSSKCDEIISELQTLKSTISTLSSQLAAYGSILSTLEKQYPSTSFRDQTPPRPSIISTTSPPNIMNFPASPQTSPPLPLTNNCPQQQSFSRTQDNNPLQRPSSNSPPKIPSLVTFGDILQFSCEQCDYKCRAKSALKRHITMKHGLISNVPYEPHPPITSSPHIVSSRKRQSEEYITPVPSSHNISSPQSSNISIVTNLNVAPSPLNENVYPCNICANYFPTIPSLNSHIVDTHMSLEEYQNLKEIDCPHCLMTVTFHKDSLLNHKSVCIVKECPKTNVYCNQQCFYQEYQCPHCIIPILGSFFVNHKSICTIPKCPKISLHCHPECYYQKF